MYRTPRPLEAITDAGTNPNAVPLEKFIIEGEESSDRDRLNSSPFSLPKSAMVLGVPPTDQISG
jgi:hypothetical protein